MTTPSTISLVESPADPELADTLNDHKRDVLFSIHAHHVATIQSFDPVKQVCTATINYQSTYFEKDATDQYVPVLEPYPVLVDVPVIFLGGNGGALTFPIVKGDECLLLFNDRDIDTWFSGSSNSANPTGRLHSFSDAFALVGVRNLSRLLTGFDGARVVLQNGNLSRLAVGTDHVALEQGTGATAIAVKAAGGKFTATNATAEYTATLSKLITDLTALLGDIQTATTTTMLGPMPLVMPNFAAHLATLNTDHTTFDTFKP